MSKSEVEILREAVDSVLQLCENDYNAPEGGGTVTIPRDPVRNTLIRARDAGSAAPSRAFDLNIIEVSKESLDCILEMAGYGISYWASTATQDDEARTYTVTENAEGEYEVHVIPYDKIIEAFWKAANPGAEIKFWNQKHETRKYALDAVIDGIRNGQGDIEAGHIDSDLADNIIQLAAFGEVQYG